jgi:hypothetical protein
MPCVPLKWPSFRPAKLAYFSIGLDRRPLRPSTPPGVQRCVPTRHTQDAGYTRPKVTDRTRGRPAEPHTLRPGFGPTRWRLAGRGRRPDAPGPCNLDDSDAGGSSYTERFGLRGRVDSLVRGGSSPLGRTGKASDKSLLHKPRASGVCRVRGRSQDFSGMAQNILSCDRSQVSGARTTTGRLLSTRLSRAGARAAGANRRPAARRHAARPVPRARSRSRAGE